MNTKLFAIAAAAFATAASFASPAAYAAEADASRATVAWGDLDLASKAGQKELARRIDTAARAVCPSEAVTGSRIDHAYQCRANVRRQVAAQLGARGGALGG